MRQFCFHQKRQHRYNLFFNRYLPEENPQKTKKNEEMLNVSKGYWLSVIGYRWAGPF